MPYDPERHVGRLLRLDPACYLGRSFVHWSMAMERRATGWLDPLHHAQVREMLCHVLGRYWLACPAYCLMPDHGHFLFVGLAEMSNQRAAVARFRETWGAMLALNGYALQRQPHDHVLREHERERGAFGSVAHYVFENPVRAELIERWQDYPHLGAVVPGYPTLDPRKEDYWDKFWRIYAKLAAAE
jgi:putative transposase